jgi:hypothetical protein
LISKKLFELQLYDILPSSRMKLCIEVGSVDTKKTNFMRRLSCPAFFLILIVQYLPQ